MLLAVDHQRFVGDRDVATLPPPTPARIVLYSHDTVGMGHLRRNLLIAQSLCEAYPHASILLISGAMETGAFLTPPHVDCLALPGLRKQEDGSYCARRWDVALSKLIALRAQIIWSAVESFNPDALIVDNVPRGAVGELDLTLGHLRRHTNTCCILGLRDVLDEPSVVEREWRNSGYRTAISDYYDAVWIYGDPAVYDAVAEYRFPADVAGKVHYTGYQDRCWRLSPPDTEAAEMLLDLKQSGKRLMLCLVGGGEDGLRLTQAFAKAELPSDSAGVIIAGPYMPASDRAALRQFAARRRHLRTLDFTTDPESLIRYADRVVTMGGYNTVAELLSFEKRSLIVPRVRPRAEQLIRAERLQALGLVDMLHPDDLSAAALSRWMACTSSPPQVRQRIDFSAGPRLPRLLEQAMATRTVPTIPPPEAATCELPTY